jgi:glyoxylase-like metal-dependent hydrolase (beta-lactamase superfamily II)
MIFRQLCDRETSTYTYLLACERTREAVVIDPVIEQFGRDTRLLQELGLSLVATLETHVHADHITGGGQLRNQTGAKFGVGAAGQVDGAELQLVGGDTIRFGDHQLEVRSTPGHTSSCLSYYLAEPGLIFTGDALLIRGCGRTDFQEGDSRTLYRSVHEQILSLPDRTRIYPRHDYKGRIVSTVAEEKEFNPRLGGGRTADDLVAIMDALNLDDPEKLAIAVSANQSCGGAT